MRLLPLASVSAFFFILKEMPLCQAGKTSLGNICSLNNTVVLISRVAFLMRVFCNAIRLLFAITNRTTAIPVCRFCLCWTERARATFSRHEKLQKGYNSSLSYPRVFHMTHIYTFSYTFRYLWRCLTYPVLVCHETDKNKTL